MASDIGQENWKKTWERCLPEWEVWSYVKYDRYRI